MMVDMDMLVMPQVAVVAVPVVLAVMLTLLLVQVVMV